MIQGKLGLSYREKEQVKPTQVKKITPRQVTKWVGSLPIANTGDTSKRLYQMLLECNKSKLGDDDRYKIMMQLHPVIHMILKTLSKSFTGHTLNLTNRQRKISALVQALHTEMAVGFKNIIEHRSESINILNKKMMLTSLYLTLDYLSLTIVRCYQIYTVVPDRIWQEINTLYRFAVEKELHDKKCPIEGYNVENSIHDLFIRICLLSISNPYQLRQQEIETLFKSMPVYTQLCELDTFYKEHTKNTCYVIDLNSGFPPTHQNFLPNQTSLNALSLNLDSAIEQLQKELENNKRANPNLSIHGLSIRLIRHLLKNWAQLTERSASRTSSGGKIHVTVGLAATYQYLCDPEEEVSHEKKGNGTLLHATVEPIAEDDPLVNPLLNTPDSDDVWDKYYQSKDKRDPDREPFGKRLPELDSEPQELLEAEIINMSPGGYCLHLVEQPPANTHIGEIIGLLEIDGDGSEHWHIGVIRWLKRQSQVPGIQFGIQLIAPSAKAVITETSSATALTKVHESLLLPELAGIGQAATVITPGSAFKQNQEIKIINGERVYDVKLTKIAASSQSFKQYYFERSDNPQLKIKSKKTAAQKPADPPLPKDGLEGVWDLI